MKKNINIYYNIYKNSNVDRFAMEGGRVFNLL